MTTFAVPDLMLSLSAELARLAAATEAFHELIPAESRDAALIRKAQGIDHATQALAELAEFCANIAAGAPTDCHLPAAQALALLRLGELRDRLSPGQASASHHAVAARHATEGALELF